MSDEDLVRNYVRSQWKLEQNLDAPEWLEGEKLLWWIDEAKKIWMENKK